MSRFFESIKLQDGRFKRLERHQLRINSAFAENYPHLSAFQLAEQLTRFDIPTTGLYKCRVSYDTNIRKVEFTPYSIRHVGSLRLVSTNMPSHFYKTEDRLAINEAFTQRGDCDDVLLIRDGLITDASYSNVAFFDGKLWFTPATPLIYGVNRAELIETGILTLKDIRPDDLGAYRQVALYNAMIEFGQLVLNIDSII